MIDATYLKAHRTASSELHKTQWLLGDRGYDADWFRDALQAKGIQSCISGRKSRNAPVRHDKRRYRGRNRIEIMFGRLKDWRPMPDGRTSRLSPSQPQSSSGYN